MKKLLSVLLLAGVILSFTACKSGKDDTTPTTDNTNPHDHTHATDSTTAPTEASQESEVDPTSPEITTETPITPDSTQDRVTRGSISGDTYKNSILNLSFTLPSGWIFYSDKELCSLSGLSVDNLSHFTDIAESNPAVYDMYAIHKESGASVSLCYENLLYTTGSTLTAKEYLEVIKAAVSGAGVSQIEDHGTVNLCSGSYESATITSGASSNQQTHFLKAYNQYMVTIIVTSPSAQAEADILKMFS